MECQKTPPVPRHGIGSRGFLGWFPFCEWIITKLLSRPLGESFFNLMPFFVNKMSRKHGNAAHSAGGGAPFGPVWAHGAGAIA